MILQRLYELAETRNLLADPSVSSSPVACQIEIARDGTFINIHDLRERKELDPSRKGGKPKTILTKGRLMGVPVRPVVWDVKSNRWKSTDPASAGVEKPAVFLSDTIARVLPVERLIEDKDREKFRAQRSTFWRFLEFAAQQHSDDALTAMVAFGKQLATSNELQERLTAKIESDGFGLADGCTFALRDDVQNILQSPARAGD
jgi:hypothetical protein